MIPRFKPTIGLPEWKAILTPSRPDAVERYEAAFAAHMGQRHAVALAYGRTGLLVLLKALGIKDKEIICPAYTCVVVPHAIVESGNEPVFVDSSEHDFNMDLDLAEAAITKDTVAIIATSIFGYPVDLDRLDLLHKKFPQLLVIQDCAHSFDATWHGRPVQQAGEAAIFGLNISKNIHSIFGGMVTTDNDNLAARIRAVRTLIQRPAPLTKSLKRHLYLAATAVAFTEPMYGLINAMERRRILDRFTKYYDENIIDLPADHAVAMTPVEAEVGLAQIPRAHTITAIRREAAKMYHQGLNASTRLRLPPLVEGATYSHFVALADNRDDLLEQALIRGVQLGRLIEYSIPEMAAYQNRPGARHACPVAKSFAEHAVNLPVFSVEAARRVLDQTHDLWQ